MQVPPGARLTTVDYDVDAARWEPVTGTLPMRVGEEVVVGRAGDLPLAVDPVDTGVSRAALRVRIAPQHWDVDLLNANHGWLQPWGQRATWVESGTTVRQRWPLVGVLLTGRDERRHHWVLLETNDFASQWRDRAAEAGVGASTETSVRHAAGELTPSQLEAIGTVFGPHLSWPPTVAAEPVLLESAARRLGVAPTAVAQRLGQARKRAYALGPHRQTGVMNPEYVYVLASAGYLPLPPWFARPGPAVDRGVGRSAGRV